MANTILVQTHVAAMDVDSYNRVAYNATTAFQNGAALAMGALVPNPATGRNKMPFVFQVAAPAAVQTNVWLAYSPEVNILTAGASQYKGLNNDPRDFTNIAGMPFDAFKPVVGDLIQVNTSFFSNAKDPGTVAGATVVEMTAAGAFESLAAATSGYAGIAFKILRKEPMIVGSDIVDAWILECTAN